MTYNPATLLMMRRILYYSLILLFTESCNSQTDDAFDSPYSTFVMHQTAIDEGNTDIIWNTYSTSYQNQQVRSTWHRKWEEMDPIKRKALLRREITKEHVINSHIAYLLLDSTTLTNDRESPFVYFINELGNWKITTHLDSSFHNSLEQAIENGDYKLPDQQ